MRLIYSLFFLCLCLSTSAQLKPTDLDKSPLDVSYCPANYPILKLNGRAPETPIARVIYSRPSKAGRQIFDGIVKYGEVWRIGANEATEIEFFKNVRLGDKNIQKGRYTLYAICNADKWTLILSSEKDVWGLYYNQKKDVARIDAPVIAVADPVEPLTIYFDTAKTGYLLNITWDDVKVSVPLQ